MIKALQAVQVVINRLKTERSAGDGPISRALAASKETAVKTIPKVISCGRTAAREASAGDAEDGSQRPVQGPADHD